MLWRLFTNIVQREPPRIVVDTNVLISATLAKAGPSRRIVDAARTRRFVLVTSQVLIQEYEGVIVRRRIAGKYKEVAERRLALMDFVRSNAAITPGQRLPDVTLRDPEDIAVLSCAIEGKTNYIISGDLDLVELGAFRGIPILSPAEFAKRFGL
jgi:putative PIN family toxin of toxin-antitoxin system